MTSKTNPDLPFSKRPIFSPEELEEAKRQNAEDIFKDFDVILETIMAGIPIGRFGKAFRVHYFHVKQKYLQNPQTQPKDADNQERDSQELYAYTSKESRPDVLKVSNAKELVETLKDNNNKEIVFIEEGCGKILGNFPFSDLTSVCGDGFDGETILCEDCRAKQKAQELNK